MKIQLEHLGGEPLNWQEDLDISRAELGSPELRGLSSVKVQGSIGPVFPGYLMRASLAYSQSICCDRCLGEARQDIEIDFSLLLLIESQREDDEVELAADDLDVIQLPGPEFDTWPSITEQVQLHVPMKPVCKADCQGLCSHCGGDLNQGPCDCRADVDPRWAALAGLKRRFDK